MAATIDKRILDAIMVGSSSLRIVDKVDTLTDTTFDDANEIFTIQDTLSVDQAEPTANPINIDQSDLPVKTTYTAGEYTVSGDIPSIAEELLSYLYDKSTTQPTLTTGITSSDGVTKYKGAVGYFATPKRKNVTMLIEDQDKKFAIAFMNVELVASQSFTNVKTTPFIIRLTGSVLTNTTKGSPDWVVLKVDGNPVSPASLSAENKSGSIK